MQQKRPHWCIFSRIWKRYNFKMVSSKIISLVAIFHTLKRRKRRNKKLWVKKWMERNRGGMGDSGIMNDLRLFDEACLKNYLRMEWSDYQKILLLIKNIIQNQDTSFREAIPAHMKLATTLRYLATGIF